MLHIRYTLSTLFISATVFVDSMQYAVSSCHTPPGMLTFSNKTVHNRAPERLVKFLFWLVDFELSLAIEASKNCKAEEVWMKIISGK